MNATIDKFLSENPIEPSADFTNRVCAVIAAERAIDAFLADQPIDTGTPINVCPFPQKNYWKKLVFTASSLAAAFVAGTLIYLNFSQNLDQQIDQVIAQDCAEDFETLAEFSDLIENIDSKTLEIFAYND